MGSFGLVFKQRVRVGVNASDEFLPFGAVELDASLEENHTAENEITQFPVEVGVDITDHVRKLPEGVTIRGVVTDHPLVLGGAFRSGRSTDAYQEFLVMLNQAQFVAVVTTLRQYANMVVQRMEVPRNSRRGSSVEFVLTLREVKTAEVAVTTGTTDLGTQNTVAVN